MLSVYDGLNLSLKSRLALSGIPRVRAILGEHELDLLERLTAGLGVEEPEPTGGSNTEDAEDDE
jgi:hypothetical protein